MKLREIHQPEQRHDAIKSHHIEKHRHVSYRAIGKLAQPSVCPKCSAVSAKGRWQWVDDRPNTATEVMCPACHRINDKYSAGELTLSDTFVAIQGKEIISLARNTEAAENRDHALQRIMDISEYDNSIVITTADIHLPQRSGTPSSARTRANSRRSTTRPATSFA